MPPPQVVRELQRTRVAQSLEWRRGFGVFTFFISCCCGVTVVFFGIPEKDFKGRDHVFSDLQRYYKRKRDEFFDVPPTKQPTNNDSKLPPKTPST
jgi:hypothetical protein